jgi:ribosomal protein S4
MMVMPESLTILDSLAPDAPQIDSQVAEQLIVEFYSK